MLVMLGLGLSVSGVLFFPCLPWLLRSLSVFSIVVVRLGVCCRWGVVGFLHLVVLYGYQGTDREAEKLALTDQLLDAAFGELGVVPREQPSMVVGDFNVEPTKIPCLAKGISAGLWVDLEAAWAFASGRQPGVNCKRSWDSAGGSRRDFMVGCPRAAAAVSWWVVQEDRWILPHLAVRTHFEYSRWVSLVSQPVQRTPLWPASWLPVLDKSRGSKSAEVQRVWGIYDDRLQFMTRDDTLGFDGPLGDGNVSRAWSIWSSAAEAALVHAYQFAGGPVPDGFGLGSRFFCAVKLGGSKVRKARRNFADPLEGGDVFMYHDASTAVLLDLRCRFKAVGSRWLGLLSSPFSGMGSFGLGQFILSLCRILRWLGVVVLGYGRR